jgi:hypothetical protein
MVESCSTQSDVSSRDARRQAVPFTQCAPRETLIHDGHLFVLFVFLDAMTGVLESECRLVRVLQYYHVCVLSQ